MASGSSYTASEFLDIGGYDSSFEPGAHTAKLRATQPVSNERLLNSDPTPHVSIPSSSSFIEAYSREEGKIQRYHLSSLDAYSRHKKLINDYFLYHPGATKLFQRDVSKDKRDIDFVKENHKFLWNDSDDEGDDSWEKRLARKYYDKLFKEYCIADLSKYKENKAGMRWRIEKEVIEGKGQFICGARRCSMEEDLTTWEVNFGYVEHNEKKNALVKLRLCTDCSYKLNYHNKKRKFKKQKRKSNSEYKEKLKRRKSDKDVGAQPSEDSSEETNEGGKESKIWSQQPKVSETEDKSKTEEMEEFLEDLFL